jgi:AraC family transcriptional activator of mtrCDE
MTMAANELRHSTLSTGAVAEAVGYQSEAAFQRAFKSHLGITPAQWRKTQEASGREVFARPAAVAADAKAAETLEVDPPSHAGRKGARRSVEKGDRRAL